MNYGEIVARIASRCEMRQEIVDEIIMTLLAAVTDQFADSKGTNEEPNILTAMVEEGGSS